MHLTKHHVFGNDFLVLLGDGFRRLEVPPGAVRALCDRTRGVGADGLICVRPDGTALSFGDGPMLLYVAMTLYNADGSRAEVSGNGLACVAQAVAHKATRREAVISIFTEAGERMVVITDTDRRPGGGDNEGSPGGEAGDRRPGEAGSEGTSDGEDADEDVEVFRFGQRINRARVGMGQAETDPDQARRAAAALAAVTAASDGDAAAARGAAPDAAAAVAGAIPAPQRVGYVSVGNPHIVVLLTDDAALDALDVARLGRGVEQHFGPVNVEAVVVGTPSRVRMRVWERGVGITSACGSGATAAAWQLNQWGLVADAVTVEMPGGTAEVVIGEQVGRTGPWGSPLGIAESAAAVVIGDALELRVPVTSVARVKPPRRSNGQ